MKLRHLSLIAALITSTQFASAADLRIDIADIRKDTGPIMLTIVNSPEALASPESAVASMILPANLTGVSLTLRSLTPGTYGIRVMHDVNGNGKLDANLLGIPKEPWGFSNNAAGSFGPPKWDAIKFELPDGAAAAGASAPEGGEVVQTIRLNH